MKDIPILVADDDESLVAIISEVLRDDGYEVSTATNGEDALGLFRARRFPLVITDIRMPGMTGIELLKEVKKISPETEVVIITSYASVETTVSALRLGAYDYLMKPFEQLELISAVVNRALEKIRLTRERQVLLDGLMRNKKELENLNSILHNLSVCDGLTGLYNHRYFQEAGTREIMRCQRTNGNFSLIFLDVDHFKHFNDKNGHPAGDALLKTLAELVTNRLRRTDVAARYGGEEFIVLLPDTSKESAVDCAETLRQLIAEHFFPGCDTQPLGMVSVSIGVSSYPGDGNDLATLIKSADNALYRAKAAGRNKIFEGEPVHDS